MRKSPRGVARPVVDFPGSDPFVRCFLCCIAPWLLFVFYFVLVEGGECETAFPCLWRFLVLMLHLIFFRAGLYGPHVFSRVLPYRTLYCFSIHHSMQSTLSPLLYITSESTHVTIGDLPDLAKSPSLEAGHCDGIWCLFGCSHLLPFQCSTELLH